LSSYFGSIRKKRVAPSRGRRKEKGHNLINLILKPQAQHKKGFDIYAAFLEDAYSCVYSYY
jgi:hypothetical protein